MKKGDCYLTNTTGLLEVVEYINARNVEVVFPLTKYTTLTRAAHIKRGSVRDPYYPIIENVGYTGEGKHLVSVNRKVTPAYAKWKGMLQRCYDPYICNKYLSYTKCTVVKEWHNFQCFAEWFYSQDHQGKQLDKDILVDGNTIYGPDTCLLVSAQENTEKACAKTYKFVSPSGEVVTVYNLTKFSRENGLRRELLGKVHRGERAHHLQWRKYAT